MVTHEGDTPPKLPLCRPKADKAAVGSRNLRTRGDHSDVKVTLKSGCKFWICCFIWLNIFAQVWT
jgi:hypothetical protein